MAHFLYRNRVLLLMASADLLIHLLLVHSGWELHRDELLYLAEGSHPAWGYLEVPPTLGLLAFIIQLFGSPLWMVRLVPALFGALTLFFTGKIIMEMGGSLFAQWLGCIAYLASGYLRLNLLFQANSPEVLYFTVGAYYVLRYIHTSRSRYLIYIGLIIGAGMMNKYSMLLFVIGLLAGILLTPYRRLFRSKYFYLAGSLSVLIFLPNFLWQAFHHFPVISHMKTLAAQQLQYNSVGGFIGGQMINCFPSIYVWTAGLIYFLLAPKGKPYRIMAWMYLTVIILLIVLHGKAYYAMGTYPMLMAGGAVWLEQLTCKRSLRLTLRPVLIVVPLLLAIQLFPLLIPVFSPAKMAGYCARYKALGLLRWEDGRNHDLPQDYADMIGWKTMAELVGNAYLSMDDSEKTQTIIFCDNYGEAGAVEYYGRPFHLPPVQCKEASFILWNPLEKQFRNIILVTDDPDDLHNPLLVDHFQSVKLLGRIEDRYARERGTLVLLCKGASKVAVQFVNERNQRLKAQF